MIVKRLHAKNAIWTDDAEKLSTFILIKARDNWRAKNTVLDQVVFCIPLSLLININFNINIFLLFAVSSKL